MNKVNSKKVSPEAKGIVTFIEGMMGPMRNLAKSVLASKIDFARRREIRGVYKKLIEADRELEQIITYLEANSENFWCHSGAYKYDKNGVELTSRASLIIGFIESLNKQRKCAICQVKLPKGYPDNNDLCSKCDDDKK